MGKSFTTVEITNILEHKYEEIYTDPMDPQEKVEFSLEAGETISIGSIVGDTIVADIAGVYCASKGQTHYGKPLQDAIAMIKNGGELPEGSDEDKSELLDEDTETKRKEEDPNYGTIKTGEDGEVDLGKTKATTPAKTTQPKAPAKATTPEKKVVR